MRITWDEPKRLANIDKHGFDFAALDLEFFLNALVIPAKKGRLMAIGRIDATTLVVIFVRLGSEGISVISMLRASPNERRLLR